RLVAGEQESAVERGPDNGRRACGRGVRLACAAEQPPDRVAPQVEALPAEPAHLFVALQLLGPRQAQRELAKIDRELREEQPARLPEVIEVGRADRAHLVGGRETARADFEIAGAQAADALGHQTEENVVARTE